MKYTRNALITLFFIFKLSNAQSQETIIDDISYPFLERLIETAQENYPGIKSFDPRIKRAELGIGRARVGWLTPLSFSYVYQPASTINLLEPTRNSLFSGFQVGAYFQIGSFLQNPYNVKQAREEAKTLEFEKQAYVLSIETQVRSRYFIYIQKLSTLKLRSRGVLEAQALLADFKARYEKSEITYDEYAKALLSSYEQTQTKLLAESEMLVAKANLEELLGKRLEEVK